MLRKVFDLIIHIDDSLFIIFKILMVNIKIPSLQPGSLAHANSRAHEQTFNDHISALCSISPNNLYFSLISPSPPFPYIFAATDI